MSTREKPPRSWRIDDLLDLGKKEGVKSNYLKTIPVLILERWVQGGREEKVANFVWTKDIARRLVSHGLVRPFKPKGTSNVIAALTGIQNSRNLTRPRLIEYQGEGRSWVNLPHYEPLLQEYRQKYSELFPEDYRKLFPEGEPEWEPAKVPTGHGEAQPILAESRSIVQDLSDVRADKEFIASVFADLFIDERIFYEIRDALLYKKNIILQGPPGTGKTFLARRLAETLVGQKGASGVEMIQFHQSYAYEDFIQGYRPTANGSFELRNGVFYRFAKMAQEHPHQNYFFVIDEINRANLSKVFGELMILIECDKRGPEHSIPLAYSPAELFFIPTNLHLIGTMNTADRSITIVDYALRRRFLFFNLKPEFGEKFRKHLLTMNIGPRTIDEIISRISKLNEIIAEDDKNLGPGFEIGHSYFCPLGRVEDPVKWYNRVIDLEIKPLLTEYWFDDPEKAKKLAEGLRI